MNKAQKTTILSIINYSEDPLEATSLEIFRNEDYSFFMIEKYVKQ
jgi:hypothetical protein